MISEKPFKFEDEYDWVVTYKTDLYHIKYCRTTYCKEDYLEQLREKLPVNSLMSVKVYSSKDWMIRRKFFDEYNHIRFPIIFGGLFTIWAIIIALSYMYL